MRILFISESPLEKVGDAYFAVDSWITIPRLLSEEVDRLTLWSPLREVASGDLNPRAWQVPPSAMVIEPHDHYWSVASYWRLFPRRARAWYRRARDLAREHDVVVLRLPSPMDRLVARALRKERKPLVGIVLGDVLTQSERVTRSQGWRRFVYRLAVKGLVAGEVASCRDAAAVYCYSEPLMERHQRSSGRVQLMRDPNVSLAEFSTREDTCQGSAVRLVRVCSLQESKGVDVLLRAVALLRDQGRDVRLEVIGDERYPGRRAALQQLSIDLGLDQVVTFSGWQTYDGIAAAYLRADIQVISSFSEGFPRVVAEGGARGLPLVATAIGGMEHGLQDGRDALLVPAGNPAAIADAVARLIDDGDLRRRLVKGGYDLAASLSFEESGRRFLAEVKAIVDEHGFTSR